MSDNEIRKVLVERKKHERMMKRREVILEAACDLAAWSSLIAISFMLSVIGG